MLGDVQDINLSFRGRGGPYSSLSDTAKKSGALGQNREPRESIWEATRELTRELPLK